MVAQVDYVRDELNKLKPRYLLIKDCIEGSEAVKTRKAVYLPRPNPEDKSTENTLRYEDYLTRAVFYNATGRTLDGMLGIAFNRPPVIELPSALEPLRANADGGGVSLEQNAKKSLSYTISYGRSGLFVDYPTVDGPTDKATLQRGNIGPSINLYGPLEIINWREVVVNGIKKLSLVVLAETAIVEDDGYRFETNVQYRVLRLNAAGVYEQEVFIGEDFKSQGVVIPRGYNGLPFDEIPFKFIGSENNDADPDKPPLYDLAEMNIGHFRNSADYEESAYIVGQPTPYFSGLTEEWVTGVLKNTVYLGARAIIPLPAGGDAGLLQAAPNQLAMEAMKHKEGLMIALGAKLIQSGGTTNTKIEAAGDQQTSQSVLSTCAKNVADAYLWALTFAGKFVGAADNSIKFELSTEFDLETITSEELTALIAAWQARAIVTSEMRARLTAAGIATLPEKEYEAEKDVDAEFARENDPAFATENDPHAGEEQ